MEAIDMANKIIDSFDVWIRAQGIKSRTRLRSVDNISLEGVARLRELILNLAVEGKLVYQDINEESARILLKKFTLEKDKKEFEDKSQKVVKVITEDETTFSLPVGWAWERFGNIALIERGGSPRPINSFLTSDSDGLNWIKIGDTDIGGKYITRTEEKIRRDGLTKTRMVYPGDFLLTNSMSFGRPYITKIAGCIHDGWLRIHPPSILDKDFLYHLLSSPYVKRFFKSAAAGAVVQNLNADKVRELPIPIPPLKEQSRIVAKVDELMALCDELEKQEMHHLKSHQLLVETLLGTLTRATDAAEFQTAWSRLTQHFDDIFTTEDSIGQLKQTILQLAVMGKLVSQDSNDEPASMLLKKIEKEKERLVNEGKIKEEKQLPKIKIDEMPFKPPKGWQFARLGQIANKIGSGSTPRGGKEAYVNKGILFLRSQNVWDSGLDLSDVAYITEETHESMTNTKVFANDILLNITGGSLGRSTIVPESLGEANVSQHVTIIRPTEIETRFFLHLCLLSPYGQNLIWGRQVGANREGLSKKVLELFEIPIPPLNEQLRIIKKIDELFALCDRLKTRITESQNITNELANSVLNLV